MGRAPDKKPRKTPNRVYETLPETEAVRIVGLSLRPIHLWMLEQVQSEGEGFSRKMQLLIQNVAAENGVSSDNWSQLTQEDKQVYLKGKKGSTPAELERRKQKRRERA